MFKKIVIILLFSANLHAGDQVKNCGCNLQYNEPTTMTMVLVWGTIGTGAVAAAVVAAPLVLPASAIAAITAATAATKVAIVAGAAQAAPFVIPSTTAGKVGLGLSAAQYARPHIVQTTEEARNQLVKKKASKAATVREEFITCLKQNKFDSTRNNAGRPTACEDLALAFALVVGNTELNQRTKAFNNGKCFCS